MFTILILKLIIQFSRIVEETYFCYYLEIYLRVEQNEGNLYLSWL